MAGKVQVVEAAAALPRFRMWRRRGGVMAYAEYALGRQMVSATVGPFDTADAAARALLTATRQVVL
jgi:hypothetical protein